MKRLTVVLLVLVLCLIAMPLSGMADDQIADEKSYYKYPPSQVQQPASIWNPIIHSKDGKVTGKSYFKYPDSKVLPQGSIWNPLVTIKKDGK